MDTSNISQVIKDAAAIEAAKQQIPLELILAICVKESSAQTYASRFEPHIYAEIMKKPDEEIKKYNPCSRATERVCQAMSFGPMQVMGQSARFMGYTKPFLTELCNPSYGIEYGCKVLKFWWKKFKNPYGFDAVMSAYNGGSGAVLSIDSFKNPQYPQDILAILGGTWPEKVL